MSEALIGHTGFVGGNLKTQHAFTHFYASANSDEMRGKTFDLLVCSGARAEKWKANKDPQADLDQIKALINNLSAVKARNAILMSTVDVFPDCRGKDEGAAIDASAHHAYGKHRYALEMFFAGFFPNGLIVRLPALYGPGLKKNAVYDLLHGNQVEAIHPDSRFQFYNLKHLWADIEKARAANLRLIHFAVEPTSMREVARDGLGIELKSTPATPAANYDFKSRHASLWGRTDGYLYSRAQVLGGLREFAGK